MVRFLDSTCKGSLSARQVPYCLADIEISFRVCLHIFESVIRSKLRNFIIWCLTLQRRSKITNKNISDAILQISCYRISILIYSTQDVSHLANFISWSKIIDDQHSKYILSIVDFIVKRNDTVFVRNPACKTRNYRVSLLALTATITSYVKKCLFLISQATW